MILRLLPVIFITLVLPNLYLYFKYWRKKYSAIKILSACLLDICLIVGAIIISCNETMSPGNLAIISIYLLTYMLVALPKTIYVLSLILFHSLGRIWSPINKIAHPISLTLRIIIFICILVGIFYGPRHLIVKTEHIQSHQVPQAFDGYRIVQFTDSHLASFAGHPEMVRSIVDRINSLQPDMIVFTGDLVNIDSEEMLPYLYDLSRLSATDGVYSILGNHDYHTYARYLTPEEQSNGVERLKELQGAIGWKLLLNEHHIIHHKTDSIAIIGVENDGKPPFPERGDLTKATAGINNGTYKILLSHDPSHWQRKVVNHTDIQLTLSGHTHGMQFTLFGWSPAQHIYPEWGGTYEQGGQMLHVSLGVGGALIPFRFGAWPEISLIVLQHI